MAENAYGLPKGAIKAALFAVLQYAYAHASGDGELPAPVRTVFYSARPLMLAKLGVPGLSRTYMDQFRKDVREYLELHPDKTTGWDIVFDARGNFAEPHSGTRVPLGTIDVRRYLHRISLHSRPGTSDGPQPFTFSRRYDTAGPLHRYGAVVYIEKEGLDEVLTAGRIKERFDVGIASCKGQSVGAFRLLIDELSRYRDPPPVYVVHDFDKAGFEIAGALGKDSRVHRYQGRVNVRRLGLRLEDVRDPRWGLAAQAEPQVFNSDPRPNLLRHGARDDDLAFLVDPDPADGVWTGRRIELNALTGPQLVEWLAERLEEEGVRKVLPNDATLADAWRRAHELERLERASVSIAEEVAALRPPVDLRERVRGRLVDGDEVAWDDAVAEIVAAEPGW